MTDIDTDQEIVIDTKTDDLVKTNLKEIEKIVLNLILKTLKVKVIESVVKVEIGKIEKKIGEVDLDIEVKTDIGVEVKTEKIKTRKEMEVRRGEEAKVKKRREVEVRIEKGNTEAEVGTEVKKEDQG